MKNKLLTYLLIAGGVYYIIYASKTKKKAYTITVPEPDKLTEDQFTKLQKVETIFQKAAPIVKKLLKKKKQVGNFPTTF